jgi:hypothetical protein
MGQNIPTEQFEDNLTHIPENSNHLDSFKSLYAGTTYPGIKGAYTKVINRHVLEKSIKNSRPKLIIKPCTGKSKEV